MNSYMSSMVDRTENGICPDGCSLCCSDILVLSEQDISRIKKYLKKHPEIKPHNYTSILSQDYIDKCPFNDPETGKCMIYSVRPQICENFSCHRFSDPDYKPMDYRNKHIKSMLATFTDIQCPQMPNLDGLNEILEDQKERAYGKKNVR